MEIDQRGTATSGGYGGPDRWKGDFDMSGLAIEKSQQIDAPANTGLQKCYQYKITTAASGSADNYVGFSTHLEFQDSYRAIWASNSHLTFSFWVKSSITGTFGFSFNPYNVSESTNDGGNRRVLHYSNYTISAANTWEYKTITVDMATFNSSYTIHDTGDDAQVGGGAQITWVLDMINGGNRDDAALGWNNPATEARNFVSNSSATNTGFSSTTNATWKITGIQFEVGSVATPFEHRSYGDELARCQRYYTKGYIRHRLVLSNTAIAEFPIYFKQSMRANPTLSATATLGTLSSITENSFGTEGAYIDFNGHLNNNYAATWEANAEL